MSGAEGAGGYRPVDRMSDGERVAVVRDIFATITRRYDFLNRLLSLRRDIAWRRFASRKMTFFKTRRLLDVATGTADLGLDALGRHPGITVVGLDFVVEMLDLARPKVARDGDGRMTLVQGDAMALPFPDQSFDSVSVGFGLRNMPDRLAALREMVRVTVPGGRVLVLEMTAPRNPLMNRVYRLYLLGILPRLARLFSPNPEAYVYLGDSILTFPSPPELAALMTEAGLEDVSFHSLTMGVSWLHVGTKPVAAAPAGSK